VKERDVKMFDAEQMPLILGRKAQQIFPTVV
jgi:hypothetical protein